MLNWIVWKKNCFICIKMNLALNNLQMLICHKTQTNQTNPVDSFTWTQLCWPTSIHQFCVDTAGSPEDLPGVIDSRNEWWESKDFVLLASLDDKDGHVYMMTSLDLSLIIKAIFTFTFPQPQPHIKWFRRQLTQWRILLSYVTCLYYII